jgi:hypothetical protein
MLRIAALSDTPAPFIPAQTGGAAFMREGPNLLKLARKEQCMALLTQLRTGFKVRHLSPPAFSLPPPVVLRVVLRASSLA